MRRIPPRDEPPQRRPRRDLPRPEGPFERLLKQRPERDPGADHHRRHDRVSGAGHRRRLRLLFSARRRRRRRSANGGGGGGRLPRHRRRRQRHAWRPMPSAPTRAYGRIAAYIEFDVDKTGLRLQPRACRLPTTVNDAERPRLLHFRGEPLAAGAGRGSVDSGGHRDDASKASGGRTSPSRCRPTWRFCKVVGAGVHRRRVAARGRRPFTRMPAKLQIVSPRDYTPVADGTDARDGDGGRARRRHAADADDRWQQQRHGLRGQRHRQGRETLRATHVQTDVEPRRQTTDFDGIDLEYSSVDPDNAAGFTAFVQALATELHGKSKKLEPDAAAADRPALSLRVGASWATPRTTSRSCRSPTRSRTGRRCRTRWASSRTT